MKTWIASWKPYFSLYRLKAMQETQYRAAALGGLVTQAFFGLLYVFLYTALFRGENQAELAETITYVWLQQMFFRVLLMNDTELIQQVMTGGLAYAVLRPVDQYRFAFVRNMAQRHVNALMRLDCAAIPAADRVADAAAGKPARADAGIRIAAHRRDEPVRDCGHFRRYPDADDGQPRHQRHHHLHQQRLRGQYHPPDALPGQRAGTHPLSAVRAVA